MKYFRLSIIITIIGLGLGFLLGGLTAMYITALLAILEVSLSFDNAVVNAKVLENMNEVWQKRFLTWGILIAVFGMRFLFPVLVVMIVGSLNIVETLNIAINNPEQYHTILASNENLIYAFGSAFLLMIFFDFLFEEKEVNWIKILETNKAVEKIREMENITIISVSLIGLLVVYLTKDYQIALAYFMGMLLNAILNSIDSLLESENNEVVKNGIIGLLYLEVLDASFSFDGVIGAFALSNDIFIIMIGLGIGAMFVRSLTLYLVDKGTLAEYRYLEHGANYAILVLSVIMLLKIHYHISDEITGTAGILLILTSFIHSYIENKKEQN